MKPSHSLFLLSFIYLLLGCFALEQQALFIKRDVLNQGKRIRRQTNADQMVQNILQWLQGVYTQNSRKIRQGTLRSYLPPTNTQKPRPFEPVPTQQPTVPGGGYPPAGSTPQPPFPVFTSSVTGGITGGGYPSPGSTITPPDYEVGGNNVEGGYQPYPPSRPAFTEGPQTEQPAGNYPYPSTTYLPVEKPGFPTGPPPGYPSRPTPYPTAPPPGPSTERPVPPPTQPPVTFRPSTPGPRPTEQFTSPPAVTIAPPGPSPTPDDDLNHPPHIHAIDVQCAKDMMTINIEFNRQFDGIIYSKGYYNNPECRYAKENSGQVKYTFTVNLNSCGTEFINAFDTQGQSYLENVLVLQNEPGIQEVWDTIRSVRCLWEGNLKESLSVGLSVGMLNQEIVTFSGDTAMAKLDIQVGRGPFAQPANGLVKIGETMTLVVSVSGDPGFDIQVRDCVAKDSTGENVVPLTDDDGCVLKPKLFGAFQKTRNTGDTGASIIAYAFFSAFKFPDVMDLMIECNIELCKTDCEMCPNPNQKLEPGRRRRRRDLHGSLYRNESIADGVTMGKHIRVILPEDLSDGNEILELTQNDGVCMTAQSFVISSAVILSLLTVSCLFSASVWLKNQRLALKG